jgi:hypothetical protein
VADAGDIIAFFLSMLATVLVEILAVEPLVKALLLDPTFPGVPGWVMGLLYVLVLLGSFVGMLLGFMAGLKKLLR